MQLSEHTLFEMASTEVVPPRSHVTCAAFHPKRGAAIVGTRRPIASIAEVNLLSDPTATVGQPIRLAFTPTQLFVSVTDHGADRVVVCLESKTVEVYAWSTGRRLLYRHEPNSETIRKYAMRYAMAELHESTLFVVPLLYQNSESGAKKTPNELYGVFRTLEEQQVDAYIPSKPSSEIFFFDAFKANTAKKLPRFDCKKPVVGMKTHPNGAPLLAVLCQDKSLRIFDVLDAAKPLLYNIAPLGADVCRSLNVPSFSRPGLNGDGRTKLLDFIPNDVALGSAKVGSGIEQKERRLYTNVLLAIADESRIIVLDLSTPGDCVERFAASAPPRGAFHGVLADPPGSHRTSGAPCAGLPGSASRRVLWAVTGDGYLLPYTMDDDICRATRLLLEVDWLKPIPLLQHACDEYTTHVTRVEQLSAPTARSAMSSGGKRSAGAATQARGSKHAWLLHGDGGVVTEWANAKSVTAQTHRDKPVVEVVQGKIMRMALAFHPSLALVHGVEPLDGSWAVRRVPSFYHTAEGHPKLATVTFAASQISATFRGVIPPPPQASLVPASSGAATPPPPQ